MYKKKKIKPFQRYLHITYITVLLHTYTHTLIIAKIQLMLPQGNTDWSGTQRNSQITPGSCCRKGFCVFHDKHWLHQQLIIGHCKWGQKFHVLALEGWTSAEFARKTVCYIQYDLWRVNVNSERLRLCNELRWRSHNNFE